MGRKEIKTTQKPRKKRTKSPQENKHLYLGKAGHLACMAEFLYLGYNVAIPEVDVGDDIFVVSEQDGTLYRVQVKTAEQHKGSFMFKIPKSQLAKQFKNPLYYAFVTRKENRFSCYLVSQETLQKIRQEYDKSKSPKDIKSESYVILTKEEDDELHGWGQILAKRNQLQLGQTSTE